MGKSKKKRYAKNLFIYTTIFVLLCLIGYFIWRNNPIFHYEDYTVFSHQVDEIVNNALLGIGIEEIHIVKRYQEEKKDENKKWVFFTKEVVVPFLFKPEFKKELDESLKKIDGSVYKEEYDKTSQTQVLHIGRESLPIEILKIVWRKEKKSEQAKFMVSIIIDDLGYSKKYIEGYVKLGIPLTFAILPGEVFSSSLATELHDLGYDILLHLPMEPEDYPKVNPGKGCLFIKSSFAEINNVLERDLKAVPYVVGVNNHMGSRFTASQKKMEYFLSLLKKKGLFYVDSYTSSNSCAGMLGSKLKMDVFINDVFLDNKDDYEYINRQFKKLKRKAIENGRALAIGHIQRHMTPKVIQDNIPIFEEAGIKFVPISSLVEEGHLYADYGD